MSCRTLMRPYRVAVVLPFFLVALAVAPRGFAQSADEVKLLRKELEEIKKG